MIRPDSRGRITVNQRARAALSKWLFEDRISPVTTKDVERSHGDHH